MAAPERYVQNTLPAYSAFIAGLSRQESGGGLDHAKVTFKESMEYKRIRGEVKYIENSIVLSSIYEYTYYLRTIVCLG